MPSSACLWGSGKLNPFGTALRSLSVDASHRRSLGLLRPLPHPATHMILPLGGRAGERAGAAIQRSWIEQ